MRTFTLGATLWLVSLTAHATPPEEAALAEELFRTAKEKMAQGDYAHACPMLAESQRVDPGGGTLLTLALCNESWGKTASAWVQFTDALAWAKREGRMNREAVAAEHLRSIEARLSRVKFDIADGLRTLAGLQITLDGVALREASWDLATPLDPGEHVVTVQAPGYETQRIAFMVQHEGNTLRVALEMLLLTPAERVARPSDSTSTSAPAVSRGSAPAVSAVSTPTVSTHEKPKSAERSTPPLRYVALGGGFVSVGLGLAGVFAAVSAQAIWKDAELLCPRSPCSNSEGISLAKDAGSRADLATALLVGSGILLVASSTLYVLAPKASRTAWLGPWSF